MGVSSSNDEVKSGRKALTQIDQQSSIGESARNGVEQTMAALDAVVSQLPPQPSDDMLEEIERAVNALHTANEQTEAGNTTGAQQAIGLARARLDRLARRLEELKERERQERLDKGT